jgi:hypothetical protein
MMYNTGIPFLSKVIELHGKIARVFALDEDCNAEKHTAEGGGDVQLLLSRAKRVVWTVDRWLGIEPVKVVGLLSFQ